MFWQTSRYRIELDRPLVMGIVNITPDSFSDGGNFASEAQAIAHCERLVREGADLLDIGGESSRPGAQALTAEEEWARIEVALSAALSLGVPISVDTSKAAVMSRALDLGVDIINDIQALRSSEALGIVAAHRSAGVCLMHMRGVPADMQTMTTYVDVVGEVAEALAGRARVAGEAGIASERIVLDPGYGFAKTTAQNFLLLSQQAALLKLGFPLLVGWSRKRSLGDVTGRPVHERMPSSLAAAVLALERGASILRVHDVAATVDVVKVWAATQAHSVADGGVADNARSEIVGRSSA